MKEKAFKFTYNIIAPINSSQKNFFSCDEYFVPYTKNQILSSPLFKIFGDKYKPLFKDCEKGNVFLDDIEEELILPNTINILMDGVYCINIALLNPILYDVLTPVESEVFLLSKISDKEKLVNLPEIMYGTNIHYIAIYTELIKYKVLEDKFVLSTLLLLYDAFENINKELAEELLIKINNKYSLNITNLNKLNKDSVKDAIFKFCNFQNINNKINYSLQIDFKDFDTFITLLKNKSIRNINDPNIYKNNCFCLAQVNDDYYFSFSGYEDKIYESLSKKILKTLKNFFPDQKFLYCERTDDMLSYGYRNKTKRFIKFSKPKTELEQKAAVKIPEELNSQYACCERKIFAYTNKDTTQFNRMFIYCKYEPCVRCKSAIEEQEKKFNVFMFFAFIKDNIAFDEYMKEKKQKLITKKSNIYTFIS